MNYPEFLQALKETPREWELVAATYDDKPTQFLLRLKRPGFVMMACPVTSLQLPMRSASHILNTAQAIGLDTDMAYLIMAAADDDHTSDPRVKQIRQDLLLACGVFQ